jgi:hypothetical protein
MIADLTRSGMAVRMQILQGPRPNSGDLQLVKLSETTAGPLQVKTDAIILKL